MAATLSQDENAQTILQALQPTRDLAKNWDIDVSGLIDQFLEELAEELGVSDETKELVAEVFNFAQAALLIQNSSAVFSRKVDFLHTYTYKVLNELRGNESKRAKQSRQGTGVDAQIEKLLNFDPDQDFLPLDDVLPERNDKINLKEKGADTTLLHRRLSNSQSLSLQTSSRRLSLSNSTTGNGQMQHHLQVKEGLRLSHPSYKVRMDGAIYIPGARNMNQMEDSMDTSTFIEPPPLHQEFAQAANDEQDVFAMGGDDDYGGDDDDIDDGPGFEMAAEFDDPQQEHPKRVTFADNVAAPRRLETLDEPPPEDPFGEMLDPNISFGIHRPLRVGKTIVLPPHLIHLPSEGSFPAPPPPPRSPPRYRQVGEISTDFGDEFKYITKIIAKLKAAEKRKNRLDEEETEDELDDPMEVNNGWDRDDNDVLGGAVDDGDDDYDVGGNDFDVQPNDGPVETNTGIASMEDIFMDTSARDDARAAKTFEELCREHIRAFIKGAEKYAVETDLSRRVREWQDKLVPHLRAEEERPEFDIHAYGASVMDALEDQEEAHFGEVVRGCPKYEISRRFLATLSLCNAGNVRFEDGLTLRVLDRDLQRPMETYQAPSTIQ